MNTLGEGRDELHGRVCVVTGGGSGIGRGISVILAAAGGKVAVLDRDQEGAQETLRLITASGGDGVAVGCDISDESSVKAACKTVQNTLGDAAVLVNNAAIMKPGGLDELPVASWNALLSVNLTGYFICSQVFGRAMRAAGEGSLVHVASTTAHAANPFAGAYSVAKSGVLALSHQLALEWGPASVRSNCVSPGIVKTPLTEHFYAVPGVTEQRIAAVPSRRIGRPEDIGEAVLFLASQRSSYVNGAEIVVDGGFSQNLMSFVQTKVP